MIDWSVTARPQKATARHLMMSGLGPRKSTIWLPGAGSECVKTALMHEVIDRDTHVYAIERDPQVSAAISASLDELGFRDTSLFLGEIENAPLDRKYDYAFLDFMGSFSEEILNWITGLAAHMTRHSVLDVAVLHNWRGNPYMSSFLKNIQERYPRLLQDVIDNNNHCDPLIAIPMVALGCALSRFKFKFDRPIIYRDHHATRMVIVRIQDIQKRRGKSEWPSLHEVILEQAPHPAKCQMRANEIANARQAILDMELELERRRAMLRDILADNLPRTIKERQRDAGRKSWETRRRNLAAAP